MLSGRGLLRIDAMPIDHVQLPASDLGVSGCFSVAALAPIMVRRPGGTLAWTVDAGFLPGWR